jgi:type 1 glutamine amidotransferase
MKKALITWGGWDGHEPQKVALVFQRLLENEGFAVEVSDSLESFADYEKLKSLDLIVPVWTKGELSWEVAEQVSMAVADGVGIAGCHGGMCDAFRSNVLWQFMTGGNWVYHPGDDTVSYRVSITQRSSSLLHGLHDFEVTTEQYYLHVDPAVDVLATTVFPNPSVPWYHSPNTTVDMPVVWTKRWGHGRVFYCSLGHHADIFDLYEPLEIMRRGFAWAAEGKDVASRNGGTREDFEGKAAGR